MSFIYKKKNTEYDVVQVMNIKKKKHSIEIIHIIPII